MKLTRLTFTALALALGLGTQAHATIITAGDFVAPTIIDFEAPPGGLIGSFYAAQGVTMAHISAGQVYATSAAPASKTGTNFYDEPGLGDGELLFSATQTRVGMDITTNDGDDTTIYAYMGATLVGSETFNTTGNGSGGSFAGVEFLSGFNRVVIDTHGPINGAFAIDNLRYEASAVPEPESLALTLAGLSVLGLFASRRRQG